MQDSEKIAAALYGHFFDGDWPPQSEPELNMGADEWRKAARLVSDEIERLTVENERLREDMARIAMHRPGTPGLGYDSIEQLVESAVSIAEQSLLHDQQTTMNGAK